MFLSFQRTYFYLSLSASSEQETEYSNHAIPGDVFKMQGWYA